MKGQSQYIGIPDSSVLVGIPTHIVTFVTDDGMEGQVHIKAGYIYDLDDQHEDVDNRFNRIKMFDNPIKSSIEDAHYVICDMLGIDINSYIYVKEDDGGYRRCFDSIPGYQIIDIRTVYTYETQADGSSA